MNRKTLIHYQATLWPEVCAAQKWNPADSAKRRDIRAACWEGIFRADKGESMPDDDAEVTALFTFLRHLAEPDNISRLLEWQKCCADYRAYNTARRADWWETRGYGSRGARKLRNDRFAGRRSAQGSALEDPLTANEANQRLWKMRQRTRQREAKGTEPTPAARPRSTTPTPDPELCPF